MRTTIKLDDHLLKEAKKAAAASGRTFTQLVEDSLREALARARSGSKRERVVLPTFGEGGVQPGVDLNDTASLLDLMDESDDDA